MLNPLITIISPGKVQLSYPEMPDFPGLTMDFNPIIDGFRLRRQPRFCLLHWQAKPFGQRRWGVYCAGNETDHYVSLKHCELQMQVLPELLQVDENLIKSVPTAVLFFPNSQIIKDGYYSINSI